MSEWFNKCTSTPKIRESVPKILFLLKMQFLTEQLPSEQARNLASKQAVSKQTNLAVFIAEKPDNHTNTERANIKIKLKKRFFRSFGVWTSIQYKNLNEIGIKIRKHRCVQHHLGGIQLKFHNNRSTTAGEIHDGRKRYNSRGRPSLSPFPCDA